MTLTTYGTMLLILFGDGVVANVQKGESPTL